ncbi:MAG: nucleotide exchange factor GrpE [Eubacterium sp.]|nr:nucleotide exchange factor GrpE [Eubacterium sp.]
MRDETGSEASNDQGDADGSKTDEGSDQETSAGKAGGVDAAEDGSGERTEDTAGERADDDADPQADGGASAGDESSDEPGDEGKQDKKSRKKKKPKKDPRDEKIAELNDRLLRNLAEFENFRNRSEKEKEARFDMGARTVVEKILPVVDNLERGIAGLSDEEKGSPFATGIIAVYKQLMTSFSEMGVTPIEALGKDFDPNLHQAVMHDEDDSDVQNQVVEELQKGYMYKDTVVRYSMVKVLN